MKLILLLGCMFTVCTANAQKVESLSFNLYTDSLKKGVHNYINVDGKLSNGSFFPLMNNEIKLTSTGGKWEGNSLIIDSSFSQDSVVITAALKTTPGVSKSITIYIKKYDPLIRLKTEKELLDEWRNKAGKKRNLTASQ